MSEKIKHECGIALIRFRQPLEYYINKYGSATYGMQKLYLLMQKQHNRGQDGAGIATLKINQKPGYKFIHRFRSVEANPVQHIFKEVGAQIDAINSAPGAQPQSPAWVKEQVPYIGELYLGHLRYGTYGHNSMEYVHPMMRKNNWRSRNLVLAGNFNMTNVDALFDRLVELGQHPVQRVDTITVLEKIGHFLDEEVEAHVKQYKKQKFSKQEITERIENELNLKRILKRSCKDFDGGFAMAGLVGNGSAFVARDPAGIRPAYYYADDEVVVVASEKAAIKTTFDVPYEEINEIQPAHALLIDKAGNFEERKYTKALPKKPCSFERIYFSRGSDPEIYKERKELGRQLTDEVLKKIEYDLENTVFSYIPNTAETAFLGLLDGLEKYLIRKRIETIQEGTLSGKDLEDMLSFRPRVEKLVIKDAKLRTFITNDAARNDFVAHVYDTTYEVVNKQVDTLVVIDDSIVRGTTLEKSIVNLLDKLEPKRIVIVSSAPQIRYPDCYGIDMSKMAEFVAFRAMLRLLEREGKSHMLEQVHKKAKLALQTPGPVAHNYVQELYDQFSNEQISDEIAAIIKTPGVEADVAVVYQTVPNLHKACKNHNGDWYFTGNYPTPGGNRVVNQSFVNFMEGKLARAY